MTPGSEVWQSHVEQIKARKERLADIRDELKVQESWWDKLIQTGKGEKFPFNPFNLLKHGLLRFQPLEKRNIS